MPHGLQRGLRLAETLLLAILLLVMIGVAVAQIVARNAFGTGFVWGEDLVQVAVLWITMLGATAAAGTDSHIRIDLVSRFADRKFRALAMRVTALFTAVLCACLAWYSIEFIRWDYLDGTPGFGVVPAWVCETIIPVAAAVIAIRYVGHAIWPNTDPQE
ncbi:MAG: TRAP transporter small permease [Gammaproteobacteria bacterium]|nr:TRAP transporter small permease [Gammaproteobacteria bacterium]MXY55719.1 TRAP transporter small permease [Gammaproteobacteria bacterium]MYF30759.1 TRAP transporter small permease [Gammaproteobacteria bacterium]MYK48517.1 TRAP transporter small permease [Gammaproteobacteria bacterium]